MGDTRTEKAQDQLVGSAFNSSPGKRITIKAPRRAQALKDGPPEEQLICGYKHAT
jgi:hypothetical protein